MAGVKFEISKDTGERVGDAIYITDAQGRIYVDLPSGRYHIVEKEGLSGYEIDSKIHEVNIREGKQEILEVYNKPMAGLRILKINSITNEPIFNVEFMVFDSNNKVVGTFYTDNRGIMTFPAY